MENNNFFGNVGMMSNRFDYTSFGSFLGNNNFVSTAIAAAITDRILELTELLYSNFIVQILNINNNKLEDVKIKLGNKNLYIGKIFMAVFRFIIMLFMIYLIGKIISLNSNRLHK